MWTLAIAATSPALLQCVKSKQYFEGDMVQDTVLSEREMTFELSSA
jgi:hypothetical protein